MLQVHLPLYRTTQRLGLEDLKKLLVVLPPLSPVPTYLAFMPALMGFDLYQMDLKPDEGMQEKALELRLHLEDLYLDFPLLLVLFPPVQ
jgi:hypothetical protein